jgi:hypothetical protein
MIRFIKKPKKVMGDYIALHKNASHLPKKFKKIKKNEVWVRSDYYNNPQKFKALKTHEKIELALMKKGIPYKKAHTIANKFEKNVRKKLRRRV